MGFFDFLKKAGKTVAGGIIRGGASRFIPIVGGAVGDSVAKAVGLKKGGKVKAKKVKAKPKAKKAVKAKPKCKC